MVWDHVASHFSHEFLAYPPWIAWKVSSVPEPLTIENGFKQNVGETHGNLVFGRFWEYKYMYIYIYISKHMHFFGVNMALQLLKCVRSESAGGAAYQAGSVSENNPPRENQQRFIGEKWWWSNLCHNVVSDGESWSYFFWEQFANHWAAVGAARCCRAESFRCWSRWLCVQGTVACHGKRLWRA